MNLNLFSLRNILLLFLIFFVQFISTNYLKAQDCEVLNYETHLRIVNNKLYESEIIVLQVNNRMGERYTEFVYQYNSKKKINSLNAQIEDIFGKTIRKLKKNEISETNAVSDGNLYSDDFYKIFWLKHNSYPYRLRVTCETLSDEFVQIARWFPIQSYKIPTRKAVLKLEVPADYEIRYRENLIDKPKVVTEQGIKKYEWKASYKDIVEKETYAPPAESLIPHVEIIPILFRYGVEGSFESWESIGQWVYSLNRDRDELTADEKIKIYNLTRDLGSDLEKTKVIYHYVQDNTRYINVSVDIGGYQTHPAAYVCYNKYGDCKALTNYTQALLKSANINSYYSLVYSDVKNIPLDVNFPVQHFNHVILNVPIDADTIWLECTDNSLPFGNIHSGIQGRYALVINDGNSRLVKIPGWSEKSQTTKRNISITIHPGGNADMHIEIKSRGKLAEQLRSFRTDLSDNEKKQAITDFFSFSDFDLINWEISQVTRNADEVSFHSELKLANYAKNYGNDMLVKPIRTNIADFEPVTRRSLPVQIDVPVSINDSITIRYPANLNVSQLPRNESIESRFGIYQIQYHPDINEVLIVRRYVLYSGIYSLEEYEDLYTYIDSIHRIENGNVFVLQYK